MLESKNLKDVCVAAELWQEFEKNLSSIDAKNHNFNLILEKKTDISERLKTIPNTPF